MINISVSGNKNEIYGDELKMLEDALLYLSKELDAKIEDAGLYIDDKFINLTFYIYFNESEEMPRKKNIMNSLEVVFDRFPDLSRIKILGYDKKLSEASVSIMFE